MENVTGEQVKAATIAAELTWIELRSCSLCDTPIGYIREGDDLFFNSACDCTRYHSPPEPRSWNDAADLINMQNDEWKPKIAAKFGIGASHGKQSG